MTATVQAMTAVARQHPAGRVALVLIWLGLLVATSGIWQLQQELSRRPLDARRVVCWACALGRHFWCTGHCDCCGGAA